MRQLGDKTSEQIVACTDERFQREIKEELSLLLSFFTSFTHPFSFTLQLLPCFCVSLTALIVF